MSTTSKSPEKVAAAAYRIACETLPEHSHRLSPKKYTQPQLLVCLVLRVFFKTEYRGIVDILNDWPGLPEPTRKTVMSLVRARNDRGLK